MPSHAPTYDRAAGVLFGLALGDALGAPTEFLSVPEILRRWPPGGPQEPPGDPMRVTDDTQMALAVGEGLAAARREGPLTPASVEAALRRTFVAWLLSPDNDRAPGRTCIAACEGLARDWPWYRAAVAGSKGCGANMRVAPVALLGGGDRALLGPIAQLQAGLTHGHPTALAAAELTALAVADLAGGGDPAGLPARLRAHACAERTTYHAAWLGPLWERPTFAHPGEFMARGWDECLAVLDRLDAALAAAERASAARGDPCDATGEGWIAEEALATGLLCFLLFPDDPLAAIRRAAVTRGDSDSIACLAGALAGARHGLGAWPAAWLERIEYRERLDALSRALPGP